MPEPYREPATKPFEPIMAPPRAPGLAWPITWRAALIFQGPFAVGLLHDVSTKAHEGLCFASGFVAMAITAFGVWCVVNVPVKIGKAS